MASLPARQPSQRRASPDHTQPEQQQSQAADSPALARSAYSEDSQTLFLNSPESDAAEGQTMDEQQSSEQSPRLDPSEDPAVKKCWICFADATEDAPETSPWRDPCPCVLVAHEECLLDWIADLEAPQKDPGRSSSKIECPQCKSEIKLSRPRDIIVEAVRGLDRYSQQLILPAAGTLAAGLLYEGSMAFGIHTIYTVFGTDDGFRILRPLMLNAVRPPLEAYASRPQEAVRQLLAQAADHLQHWQLFVGVPLIAPAMVLSRVTIADSILPVLPIAFFATQNQFPEKSVNLSQWPPSASLAFAVLPYIRSLYNTYYRLCWAKKEQQWLREVQPRLGQDQTEGAAADAPANAHEGREDENIFEVRIGGDIWEEDWDDENEQAEQQAEQREQRRQNPLQHQQRPLNVAGPAPPQAPDPNRVDVPPQGDGQADPPPNIADNRAAEPAADNQHPLGGGERRLSFSPSALAQTLLTALLYPTLASLSGEVLKLALPASWTAAPTLTTGSGRFGGMLGGRVAGKGLLQEKWGRSLVGGCLFVVVKDAVLLYVRWRMAEMHRQRRVVDFERGKKKV